MQRASHQAGRIEDVEAILASLGLGYLELPREALFLASQAFRAYRRNGGGKTDRSRIFSSAPTPQAEGFSVLTRDVSRYCSYFPGVPLIHPSQSV